MFRPCCPNPACRRFHLPKELLEGAVLNALVRRLRAMGRIENIRAQVKALLAEFESPENSPASISQHIARVEEKANNWEAAIEKGLNMDTAVEKLKGLAQEKAVLEQELAAAKARGSMSLNVQGISTEIMASLDRMQEVLEKGSVAEVKAILRAYIGRVECGLFGRPWPKAHRRTSGCRRWTDPAPETWGPSACWGYRRSRPPRFPA